MNQKYFILVCCILCLSPLITVARTDCGNEFNTIPANERRNHSQSSYFTEGLSERKKLGEKSLKRKLNNKDVEVLEEAHLVGLGEKGENGTLAQIENYTKIQIRRKVRILKARFSKTERRNLMEDGVAGWLNFWKKPPPTNVLTELSQDSTEVTSYIRSYNERFGFDDHNQSLGKFFIKAINNNPGIANLQSVGDYHYWGRYVPTREVIPGADRSLKYRGKFIIGFGIVMKISENDTRAGYWAHHIHWDSGARDMPNLDEETVKQIFTEIYGGRDPQQLMTEMQPQYYLEDPISGDITQRLISPFIYDDKKKAEVKQIILRVLQERGFQTASGVQN